MHKKQAPEALKDLTGDVAELSRDLWLAGLGAVATVEEQGLKFYENLLDTGSNRLKDLQEEATQRFEDLVERGQAFEQKGLARLTAHVDAAKEDAASVTEDFAARRREMAGKIEETVSGSVEKTLKAVDVPTRAQVRALTQQVERLTKQVNALAANLAA